MELAWGAKQELTRCVNNGLTPCLKPGGCAIALLMLAVLAFVTIQNGRVRAFNALTALVALRLLVMYFEVFGSMLNTGLGMITGGALTLLLAWVWWRQSPALARQVTRVEG